MSQVFEYHASATERGATRGYSGYERRSSDPLNQLGRRMNEVCVAAVDPLQIAAALEADGLNDELVVATYAMANVFELADYLYYRVPLRLTEAQLPFSQRQRRWRELSHGLLFALPGLFYPAVVSLINPAAATLSIVLSVIAGWGWSQIMVRVAYLLQGRGSTRETAQWLRFAALVGVGGVAAIGLVGTLTFPTIGGPVLLAVGQMAYQMAAAILIMYGREEWLLATLLPGAVVSLLYILVPDWVSASIATVAIVVSLTLSLGAAILTTRGESGKLERYFGVTQQDLLNALPFFVYGILCALLVSFDTLRFWRWIGTTGLGLTIAPLVLSMGILEWQLRHFRERVAILLARTNNPRDFADGVWLLFMRALTRYSLLLAGLSIALLPLLLAPGRDTVLLGASLLANWILGCAFFIGFALISQGRIGLVIIYLVVALSLYALEVQLYLPFGYLELQPFTSSYVLSCLVFAILLSIIAKPILCEIRNYRYDLEAARYGQSG